MSSPKKEDPDELFKKTLPPRLPKRPNDVYINQKTPFKAQMERCKKLLAKEGEVVIHGLGAAVNSAANLALQLQSAMGSAVRLQTNTSSVQLRDCIMPRLHGRPRFVSRRNSAIHITLTNVVQQ